MVGEEKGIFGGGEGQFQGRAGSEDSKRWTKRGPSVG